MGVTPMNPEPEAQVAQFLVGMFRTKSIFGEGEMEKVSPKIVSPNKEAVFFYRYFFLKMEYA